MKANSREIPSKYSKTEEMEFGKRPHHNYWLLPNFNKKAEKQGIKGNRWAHCKQARKFSEYKQGQTQMDFLILKSLIKYTMCLETLQTQLSCRGCSLKLS